ncbi:hypothetical protein AJ78_05637 [Emergomyces pasteurianus Ep9510]|uniref:Uncharacterized protein n=1 Tax=Emergomyces pasteurianus Ep9510 TaxID=1447872 RepID=A0A1J9PBS7_9EURO|nr:hypothetical protein AJ78_05637 [Emergomyces pasteurianus Ep9510]
MGWASYGAYQGAYTATVICYYIYYCVSTKASPPSILASPLGSSTTSAPAMPLNRGKKCERGNGHPASGRSKTSILGFFGHNRPHEVDSSDNKSPNNETQNPLRAHEAPLSSSPPDNPCRVSAPTLPAPKLSVPANVQEPCATATHLEDVRDATRVLSESELKYLFSGAPHFLLEKGSRLRWHPHVIFPWDDSPGIQNLADRKALQHPAFTLSTLHAHIPVSPGSGGIQIYPDDLTKKHCCTRPSFDIGVFEVPNMLSSRAKEDGCIGFRNFMELPIVHRPRVFQRPFPLRLTEKHLHLPPGCGGKNDPYSDYRLNITFDRLKLVAEGPSAWKRIGVRDCSMETITKRLQTLSSSVQEHTMLKGKSATPLDKENVVELHSQLFSKFLYPPPNAISARDPDSLRFQISTLMQVLTIKGAWVDFSLSEWKTRAGQILWELAPHQDGDCLDCLDDTPEGNNLYTALERKWLLIQIILSAEVLFRADAVAKNGIYSQSKDLVLTPRDVYLMNSLRSDMLDWGLIFSRRIFENISFHYWPQAALGLPGNQSQIDNPRGASSILGTHLVHETHTSGSPWDCTLLPRYPWQQLEALLVFAELLKWPDIENMKHSMREKLEFAFLQPSNLQLMFASPISTPPLPDNIKPLGKVEMYRRSHSSKLIQLHDCPSATRDSVSHLGGWMSRTWLTGLITPGEAICDLLMSTLLENDHDAIRMLGPIANLYGAFVYKGRSWWSKACVVGRILACLDESTICMGWISTAVIPTDKAGKSLGDGWFEIETINNTKNNTQPRINQGPQVLLESSPLGTEGEMTATAFSLPLDEDNPGPDQDTKVLYENTILSLQRSEDPSILARPRKATAALTFTLTRVRSAPITVTLSIDYNVSFISSFPCVPPYGRVARSRMSSAYQTQPRGSACHHRRSSSTEVANDHPLPQRNGIHRKGNPPRRTRLPGHPLHISSFPYSYIPIHTLPSTPFPPTTPLPASLGCRPSPPASYPAVVATNRLPECGGLQQKHTYIIDARGSDHKELFSRSWCAMVGVSAVVGRVGRTCIACCIREARAADVPVVIRVGATG